MRSGNKATPGKVTIVAFIAIGLCTVCLIAGCEALLPGASTSSDSPVKPLSASVNDSPLPTPVGTPRPAPTYFMPTIVFPTPPTPIPNAPLIPESQAIAVALAQSSSFAELQSRGQLTITARLLLHGAPDSPFRSSVTIHPQLPVWAVYLFQPEWTRQGGPAGRPPVTLRFNVTIIEVDATSGQAIGGRINTYMAAPSPPDKATIEAQGEQTRVAASLTTPDATVLARRTALFQSAHATLTAEALHPLPPPTYDVPPWSTPAVAGRLLQLIPPYIGRGTFDFTNTWYEDSQGGLVRTYVHAGVEYDGAGHTTEQGLVFVQVLDRRVQRTVVYQQFIHTPTASGIVRITGAVGELLTLQSSSGTIFYFDVPSRQFVSADPWQSPVATPTPPRP